MQITVNADEAVRQMLEIAELVRARYPEGPPANIMEVIQNIAGDRVITDGGSIVGTDGGLRIIKKMRFGKSCEALRDALLGLSPNA